MGIFSVSFSSKGKTLLGHKALASLLIRALPLAVYQELAEALLHSMAAALCLAFDRLYYTPF